MKVREWIKENYPEEWEKAQKGERVEIELTEEIIYNYWECGDWNCPTGFHLSGWKVILSFDEDYGWIVEQVGDRFCEEVLGTYMPENWEYDVLLDDLESEELLEMDIEELKKRIAKCFGLKSLDEEEIRKHNEKQIKEYEKASKELKEIKKLNEVENEDFI